MTAKLDFYTTNDDIRASLGVTPEELPDATLELSLYADNLEVELEEVDDSLAALYATTKADASPTSDEEKFIQATRLFATYAVAKHLISSIALFAPKDITDGKAALSRVVDPYKQLKADVLTQYDRFKSRLAEKFATVNSSTATTTVAKSYFGIVSPDTDPVTGE